MVDPSTTTKNNSLKSSLTKPFKSKKIALLKQNVAELQNTLKQTEEELGKAKDEVEVLSKEIQDLQSTFDGMKITHASNIDDLMERMMEEQMARSQEKKEAEEKLEALKSEYEERIMAIDTESDEKTEELSKELTEQMGKIKKTFLQQRDEIVAVRDQLIEEKDKEIVRLEKERRSVKKMGMRAYKAMKKNMFGPSQKEKMRNEERSKKKISTEEELEKSIQNIHSEKISLPFPTPLFDDVKAEEKQGEGETSEIIETGETSEIVETEEISEVTETEEPSEVAETEEPSKVAEANETSEVTEVNEISEVANADETPEVVKAEEASEVVKAEETENTSSESADAAAANEKPAKEEVSSADGVGENMTKCDEAGSEESVSLPADLIVSSSEPTPDQTPTPAPTPVPMDVEGDGNDKLTPEDIVSVLKERGWKAEIVDESSIPALIRTTRRGLMKCVDGRPSDLSGMDGPKALGGVYAIATNRDVTDINGLKAIVEEVKSKGFIPSCQGDENADPATRGCSFFDLWSQGKLEGIPIPEFDFEEGKAAILEREGVYECLKGAHEEKVVYVNFVPNTTLAPNANNQAFVVDAWIVDVFDLDASKYLLSAASTVEQLGGSLDAKIILPSPALTPNDVVSVLQGRGWEAEIVKKSDSPRIIPVSGEGLLKSVEGRPSDHSGMDGPKSLGGVYAIATSRGVTDIDGLKTIVKEVKDAGYIPSCCGDEQADPAPMGCGFFKLWSRNKLDGIAPPRFDCQEGKNAIIEAGGVYETLAGSSEEKVVYINFVPDTTIAPNGDEQAFVVDAWITEKFNLSMAKYLVAAASTVEQMKGPLKAKLIVSDE